MGKSILSADKKTSFWLLKEYRQALNNEISEHATNVFRVDGKARYHSLREIVSLLKRYLLSRPPSQHLVRYEAIWEIFQEDTPNIIVEIGSYNGHDSLELSRIFSLAKIFAFEADIKNFEKVKFNVSFSGRITAIYKAVFDHTGTARFYQSKGLNDPSAFRGSGSCLQPGEKLKNAWPDLMFDEPINVPCVKLSDWAKENNFNAIDFIWVDAQGAELSVLRGAGDLLESVHAILMEVWQKSYYEGSGCYREIKEFLESRGFRQTHVWMEGDSGDVLFANNKFRCGL